MTTTPYWEIRYREHSAGISGFEPRPIPPESRYEAYVAGIGTCAFPTFEAARAWCLTSASFAKEASRIFAMKEGRP